MGNTCFVTKIRKNLYKNGEIPHSADGNIEELQEDREKALETFLAGIVELTINCLYYADDRQAVHEYLFGTESYLSGSVGLTPKNITTICDFIELSLEATNSKANGIAEFMRRAEKENKNTGGSSQDSSI